jgi:hypothetical protein
MLAKFNWMKSGYKSHFNVNTISIWCHIMSFVIHASSPKQLEEFLVICHSQFQSNKKN